MWKLCIACTLAALTAIAAIDESTPPPVISQGAGPLFRCQIGQKLTTSLDSLRLTVAMSVPYDNLVFLRSDSGFQAQFELVTSLFRDGTGLVSEKIRTVTVDAQQYAETNSRTRNAVHVDEFDVVAGEYKVRVTMTADRESRRRSKWEGSIDVGASDPLLRMSDINWVSEDAQLAELGVPRLVEGFSTGEEDPRARIQLFSTGRDSIRLIWQVLDHDNKVALRSESAVMPDSTIQVHEYQFVLDSLAPAKYTLKVEADGNGRRETRSRPFGLRIPGIPASITDLDIAIRQLKYIASTSENKQLRQAVFPDRERLFREFWLRRDPTSGTDENELMDEYYHRVEVANEKFATHREGWDTDRGRVYILYGEPTDIERHPFDSGSRPYEIWYYSSIARMFVFVDYTGFGDYTLTGPEWGY
ncbi:GWxTD domain-containing protein [candidate division KSB1 bacterium]|nr:GWxTD domain-containing protein [candidate division KSB1 bacterium]